MDRPGWNLESAGSLVALACCTISDLVRAGVIDDFADADDPTSLSPDLIVVSSVPHPSTAGGNRETAESPGRTASQEHDGSRRAAGRGRWTHGAC